MKRLFPKFYRFITEQLLAKSNRSLVIASFVSGVLLLGIITESLVLVRNIQEQQAQQTKRAAAENEIQILARLAKTYPSYGDLYMQIAVLEYRLGNITEAKIYIERALVIDPNSKEARSLASKLQ